MIIVMEPNAHKSDITRVKEVLERKGFKVIINEGEVMTIVAAIGNKELVDIDKIASLNGVRDVKAIQEPYKLASREYKVEDSIVKFENGVKIGGLNRPVLMVGPCSVESDIDGLLEVAYAAKEMGVQFLRGGAFKPRTSPYDFQGLKEKALLQL